MTDLVTFGEAMLRYSPPDRMRLEIADQLDVRVAGAESNVATAASRIGTDAVWISKLPDSPLGRRVVNFLHSFGLETDVIWSEEGRQGTYYIEFGGEPRGTRVVYDRERSAVTSATAAELPTDQLREASMFVTSGITPALSETLARTTETLLRTATEAGTTTVFDVNYRSKLWSFEEARETMEPMFRDIDMLVVAERDAANIFGIEGDPDRVLHAFDEKWGFDTIILTRGAEGAVALAEEDVIEQPAVASDTYDPIGTGDAFLGVLLGRLVDGAELSEALEWGAAAAALKRTIPGDIAVITRKEVEQVLDEQTGGIQR